MNYAERVKRNRRRKIWTAVGFLVAAAGLYAILMFALYVAIGVTAPEWKIILSLCTVGGALAFAAGWAGRSQVDINLDIQIRDMGPITKKQMVASIEEDLSYERKFLPVERLDEEGG